MTLCFVASASQCVPWESPPLSQDAGTFHRALPPLPGARHPPARPSLLIATPAGAATLQRAQQPPHPPPFLAALLRRRYSATGACELSFSSSFRKQRPETTSASAVLAWARFLSRRLARTFFFFFFSFLSFPLLLSYLTTVCHYCYSFLSRLQGTFVIIHESTRILLPTLHRLDVETPHRYRVR